MASGLAYKTPAESEDVERTYMSALTSNLQSTGVSLVHITIAEPTRSYASTISLLSTGPGQVELLASPFCDAEMNERKVSSQLHTDN